MPARRFKFRVVLRALPQKNKNTEKKQGQKTREASGQLKRVRRIRWEERIALDFVARGTLASNAVMPDDEDVCKFS